MPRTKVAVNSPVGLRFPPARFVKLFRLLEDLQLFHGSSSQTILYLRQRPASESFQLVEECVRPSGVAAPLKALSFRGPIHKPFHVFVVFPGEMKKLAGRQIRGFFSKERLKPPADVRTFPRPESIAPSCIPVVLHRLEHFLRHGRIAQPSWSRL